MRAREEREILQSVVCNERKDRRRWSDMLQHTYAPETQHRVYLIVSHSIYVDYLRDKKLFIGFTKDILPKGKPMKRVL